ncbi:MAG: shikimate dehydrogenase [Muribaculaceae bacterium]|nr:shikimate dehydrogenase [Muribaculaceae bacterium]
MSKIYYGLIGLRLGHSFSAGYFNDRFARENIDAEYKLFEIPSVEGISTIISRYPTLRGLNVTIPYKQDVLPLLDRLTDEAAAIGAVNTIRIERDTDGKVVAQTGHNTDAEGFSQAIRPLLDGRRRALMLGLGGASKAVGYALRRLGVEVTPVSRRPAEGVLTYADLSEEIVRAHDIIVNCTPLGMWPDTDSAPDLPYRYVDGRHLCFDLVYNPEVTKFMRLCEERGARVSNGLQMLRNQADLAYEFWDEGPEAALTCITSTPTDADSASTADIESAATVRKVMSRRIDMISPDGSVETHGLSIATLWLDVEGCIVKAEIEAYTRESEGVEYFDTPLIIRIGCKFKSE